MPPAGAHRVVVSSIHRFTAMVRRSIVVGYGARLSEDQAMYKNSLFVSSETVIASGSGSTAK